LKEHGNGLIKLVRFTKTNGQAGEMMGVKVYEMDYEAEIEFLGDCQWGRKNVGFNDRVVTWAKPDDRRQRRDFWSKWAEAWEGGKPAKKGERAVVTGKLFFERTEKGWRGRDGQIY
jgi:hypothetical protein